LGGYDSKTESASLYFLDYLAAMQKVQYGAHGYAAMFCYGIMDKEYRENQTEAEAIQLVQHCINEVQTRFLISQTNFIIKAVDKDGVRVVSFGADPANT
jgi:20S proteasome alpha/beta subunit